MSANVIMYYNKHAPTIYTGLKNKLQGSKYHQDDEKQRLSTVNKNNKKNLCTRVRDYLYKCDEEYKYSSKR